MVSLGDVAVLSGEELVRRYGPKTEQGLVDLFVAALKRGDEFTAQAIELRLNEVRLASGRPSDRRLPLPAADTDPGRWSRGARDAHARAEQIQDLAVRRAYLTLARHYEAKVTECEVVPRSS